MEKTFDTLLKTRKRLQEILQNTSKEDLCKIPDGFKNNIWWNIAHVVVTQQILMYKLSGVPTLIDEGRIRTYKKGTFPEKEPTETEISYIGGALISCIEKTKEDFLKEIVEAAWACPDSTLFGSLTIFAKDLSEYLAINAYNCKGVTCFYEIYNKTLNEDRYFWKRCGIQLFQSIANSGLPNGFTEAAMTMNFEKIEFKKIII